MTEYVGVYMTINGKVGVTLKPYLEKWAYFQSRYWNKEEYMGVSTTINEKVGVALKPYLEKWAGFEAFYKSK